MSYKGKRLTFAGKEQFIYGLMYGCSAVGSLGRNPKLKSFCDRLIANHKPLEFAFVTVMRKLLGFMNAIPKNNNSS